MKIRTRLLLFLLPTLVGGIALVSTLLAYNWYQEILEGFQTRLKSAVVTTAALIDPEELQKNNLSLQFLSETLRPMEKQLGISSFYFLPIHSPKIASISKDLHITAIYNASKHVKLISGYAPIYDASGHLMGMMAADINVNLIDEKFKESLLLILCSASLTIAIVVATLFMIAGRISEPIQRLNNSALAIAAGHYGESIPTEGPKEIAELSNTLNTMSQCLHENINRLKENSLLRERMYGEYECSMLLQHLMLQKNIDDCRSDAVGVKSILFFSENPRGLLLDFPKPEKAEQFHIHLAEASVEGFEGMYQLLSQYKYSKQSQTHTFVSLDRSGSTLECKGSSLPFLWSLEKERFIEMGSTQTKIESGDFFFLCNEGLIQFFKSANKAADLLAKVLKVFASEGLETTTKMLQKEIAFMTKRKDLEEDLHLLCFQVLNI